MSNLNSEDNTLKSRTVGGDRLADPNQSESPPSEEKMIGDKSHTVRVLGHRYNSVILVTHINIFLYAMCFWIQLGTLPYLTKKLGVDAVQFGYLQTTFAIVQLAGGPLYGRFGDLYGGRAALTLAFASAALSYGLLGRAQSIAMVFISRLPSVFMHAMQGGQMVVTDMAETSQRAEALGKLGISYGVGMVVGPFFGGLITQYGGEQTAAYVAFVGSLLSILLVQMFIPKVTKIHSKPKEDASASEIFSMSKMTSLLKHPKAVRLIGVKAVSGVPIGIFQSMFSVIAMNTFQLKADQNGYIMSYIGVLAMIVQGFGVKMLTRRFSETDVITIGAAVLVFAYLALSFVQGVASLCVVLVPMTIGLTLVNVLITSAITKTVSEGDTGAMLGLNMSVNSLIRSVSPTIGGYMLQNLGFPSFGYLGFVNSALVTAYLYSQMRG